MIELVIQQRRRDLSNFEVGRVLPYAKRRMVGPYIFFDRIGPKDLEPGLPREAAILPHPHIGLSTITYLFDGESMHRDSVGSEQAALPDEREEMDPEFWHYDRAALPGFDGDGVVGRLIAGRLAGLVSPVRTESPQFYAHWEVRAKARVSLPAEYPERAVYVARGAVDLDGQRIEAGAMAVLTPGKAATLSAIDDAVVMALGGEPVGPRYIDWNFVSSSKERIDQAREDWAGGRMKLPDLDNGEFIPLPPKMGQAREPEPMS